MALSFALRIRLCALSLRYACPTSHNLAAIVSSVWFSTLWGLAKSRKSSAICSSVIRSILKVAEHTTNWDQYRLGRALELKHCAWELHMPVRGCAKRGTPCTMCPVISHLSI
eukprot:5204516-Lingulodinium_polyedra.AAC.1